MPDVETIRPTSAFLTAVESHSGEKVSRCYQCRRCTNGCPAAFAMDLMPNQIMRAIQLGLEKEVLESATIWICASCQTCTTRCPNDIDIAHLMDSLRQLSREAGTVAEPKVVKFHDAFLDSLRRHGRIFELGMTGRYMMATFEPFANARIGWEMLKRGKLKFLPKGIQDKREVRSMFQKQRED